MSVRPADAVHVSFPDQVVDRELELREGAVPAGLHGTLARNGPGLLQVGSDALHLLDGHALLGAASFGAGAPRLRLRHVETPWLADERKAGRMVHRRLFTNLPGAFANVLRIARAGSAGHDVHAWAGRLIASDDQHFAVDPVTLETEKRVRWDDGAAKTAQCPMPRPDPETGRLVGYLLTEGGLKPDQVNFVELDRGLRVLSRSAPYTLSASPAIVHDVAFTPRWYVVTEAAARLSPLAALAGRRTLFQAFGWPEGLTLSVSLVARPDGERTIRVPLPAPAKAAFHLLNAFEENGAVVVDLVVYDGPVDFDQLGSPSLRARWGTKDGRGAPPVARRVIIDPESGDLLDVRDLGSVPLELPEVDPRRFGRPYRYAFGATPGAPDGSEPDPNAFPYFHGLVRLDVTTGAATVWDAGPHRFVSQPAYAPGDAEGDGWLLAWVFDARRGETDVVVLDAADLARGPVAVLGTGVALPPATHALWTPLGATAP